MMRMTKNKGLVAAFFLASIFFIVGFSKNVLRTDAEVMLAGKLTIEKFLDANDKKENAVILILDRSINVAGDEFGGPLYDVRKVQVVSLREIKFSKYINKQVKVTGKLFYAHTAHHHTAVLIELAEGNPIGVIHDKGVQ